MHSYQDTISEIFLLKSSKNTNKHEALRLVCERLGNPHLSYKVIHITGTCGKGTVSLQTASVLMKNGHSVGLVISPHLLDFRERITVNTEKIPESYIIEKYQVIISLFKELGFEYSFEQVVCILGFLYLRDCQVEYGVIEVGCGGTRDSSNIVDPVVSVITSVGLDHMQLLGNTIEEIAIEKAGVIKPGKPVVIGPDSPQELLIKIAETRGSRALVVQKSREKTDFVRENSKITERIFEVIEASQEAIQFGVSQSQPFRYTKIKAFDKNFVIDVGHNLMSIERVIDDCQNEFGCNIRVVICASKGKCPKEFIELVSRKTNLVHLTTCSHIRIVPLEEMLNFSQELGIQVQPSLSISELLPVLVTLKDDVTLIIGSCFIIEDLVSSFNSLNISLPF